MITFVIFYFLITHTSALFFGALGGAFDSVSTNVGKLFSNVGSDLRYTYDCTVHEIETYIYSESEISEYYNKCKDKQAPGNSIVSSEKTETQKTITVIIQSIDSGSVRDNNKRNEDLNKKLESVEAMLKEQYERVEELKRIGKEKERHMEICFEKIENELRLYKETNRNDSKDEVLKLLKEITKILNNNYANQKESDIHSDIKSIIADVEKKSTDTIVRNLEKWKEKVMLQLKENNNVGIGNDTNINKLYSEDVPRNFKELYAKVSNKTLNTNKQSIELATVINVNNQSDNKLTTDSALISAYNDQTTSNYNNIITGEKEIKQIALDESPKTEQSLNLERTTGQPAILTTLSSSAYSGHTTETIIALSKNVDQTLEKTVKSTALSSLLMNNVQTKDLFAESQISFTKPHNDQITRVTEELPLLTTLSSLMTNNVPAVSISKFTKANNEQVIVTTEHPLISTLSNSMTNNDQTIPAEPIIFTKLTNDQKLETTEHPLISTIASSTMTNDVITTDIPAKSISITNPNNKRALETAEQSTVSTTQYSLMRDLEQMTDFLAESTSITNPKIHQQITETTEHPLLSSTESSPKANIVTTTNIPQESILITYPYNQQAVETTEQTLVSTTLSLFLTSTEQTTDFLAESISFTKPLNDQITGKIEAPHLLTTLSSSITNDVPTTDLPAELNFTKTTNEQTIEKKEYPLISTTISSPMTTNIITTNLPPESISITNTKNKQAIEETVQTTLSSLITNTEQMTDFLAESISITNPNNKQAIETTEQTTVSITLSLLMTNTEQKSDLEEPISITNLNNQETIETTEHSLISTTVSSSITNNVSTTDLPPESISITNLSDQQTTELPLISTTLSTLMTRTEQTTDLLVEPISLSSPNNKQPIGTTEKTVVSTTLSTLITDNNQTTDLSAESISFNFPNDKQISEQSAVSTSTFTEIYEEMTDGPDISILSNSMSNNEHSLMINDQISDDHVNSSMLSIKPNNEITIEQPPTSTALSNFNINNDKTIDYSTEAENLPISIWDNEHPMEHAISTTVSNYILNNDDTALNPNESSNLTNMNNKTTAEQPAAPSISNYLMNDNQTKDNWLESSILPIMPKNYQMISEQKTDQLAELSISSISNKELTMEDSATSKLSTSITNTQHTPDYSGESIASSTMLNNEELTKQSAESTTLSSIVENKEQMTDHFVDPAIEFSTEPNVTQATYPPQELKIFPNSKFNDNILPKPTGESITMFISDQNNQETMDQLLESPISSITSDEETSNLKKPATLIGKKQTIDKSLRSEKLFKSITNNQKRETSESSSISISETAYQQNAPIETITVPSQWNGERTTKNTETTPKEESSDDNEEISNVTKTNFAFNTESGKQINKPAINPLDNGNPPVNSQLPSSAVPIQSLDNDFDDYNENSPFENEAAKDEAKRIINESIRARSIIDSLFNDM